MANFPDVTVGKQLIVGAGNPIALGLGQAQIRGSSYIEGPSIFGDPGTFPFLQGTVMIGPAKNSDMLASPFVPGALIKGLSNPYSLTVSGDAAIFDNLDVASRVQSGNEIVAQGHVISFAPGVGGPPHILAAKKNFDIPHPNKKGYRLRHTCPEAPYNDVYIRGKVKNKDKIAIPGYWKGFVDKDSITVQLQPIGAHQDVIVKRLDDDYIYLQAKGGMPINCYYHVFAERADGEKLIPEYKGKSPEDYPGNNDEYSISGYHYDKREV